jgi:hypothetical protein
MMRSVSKPVLKPIDIMLGSVEERTFAMLHDRQAESIQQSVHGYALETVRLSPDILPIE